MSAGFTEQNGSAKDAIATAYIRQAVVNVYLWYLRSIDYVAKFQQQQSFESRSESYSNVVLRLVLRYYFNLQNKCLLNS